MAAASFYTYAKQAPVKAGQVLGFQTGKGYYVKPGAGGASIPSLGLSSDPSLQNIGPERVSAIIRSALSKLPVPQTDAQIGADVNTRVHAQYDPLLKQVDDAYTGRINRGTEAINGFTGAAQDHLSGATDAYKQIGAGDAAARAAIMQAIQSSGGDSQAGIVGGLAGKLGAIGADPSIAANAGALGGNIVGVGAARAASGLDRSLDNTNANEGLAAALPGILGAAGLQSTRLLGEQAGAEHAASLDKLNAELPSLISSLMSSAESRSDNAATRRATLSSSLLSNLLNLNTQRGIARNSFNLGSGKIDAGLTTAALKAAGAASGAKTKAAGKTADHLASARASVVEQLRQLVSHATEMHAAKTTVPNVVLGQTLGTKSVSKSIRNAPYGPTEREAEALAHSLLDPYQVAPADIDALVRSIVRPGLWGIAPKPKPQAAIPGYGPGQR